MNGTGNSQTEFELKDKTVGIVGLGRIGETVARPIKCFNTNIIYYNECERRAFSEELGIRRVPFGEILATNDILTIHVPLTPKTLKMVSDTEFGLMKQGIYLVNMARGEDHR